MSFSETAFAFGSCRMRLIGCRFCVTVLSSVSQVHYWLDVIEGKRPAPADRALQELLCYEQTDSERWKYDLSGTRTVVVEVCTAKTLWYGDHPISMLRDYRERTAGVPTTLEVSDRSSLASQIRALRDRLVGKFLILVCPQNFSSDNFSMYWATVEARRLLHDVVFEMADTLKDCAAYDPTARIAEFGASRCLLDVHHWTDFAARVFAKDIAGLVPEGFR